MHRKHSGFTLIEILIIVVVIGALMGIGLPRMTDGLRQARVRSAADAVTTMYAKARAIAMANSSYTRIAGLQSGQLTLLALDPVSGAWVTVGQPEDIEARYDVTMTAAPYDFIWINARGLGYVAEDTVVVTAGRFVDTLRISKYGRITRR